MIGPHAIGPKCAKRAGLVGVAPVKINLGYALKQNQIDLTPDLFDELKDDENGSEN